MPAAPGKKWTRDELFVALNFYHKLRFAQYDQRNPAVIALAGKLERTASSVAMKLCNLASLDPALQARGIKGLRGASALDRRTWTEFHSALEETVPASEDALRRIFSADDNHEIEIHPSVGVMLRRRPQSGPTETLATTKQRRGQDFFRDAVLNNFGGCCGVTGLAVRELLIASHILPWGKYPAERLNVRNGLSLSRLHDAAFDRGLITFDDRLRLVLSKRLRAELPQKTVAENFGAYAGEALRIPGDAALPDLAFLAKHRKAVFERF